MEYEIIAFDVYISYLSQCEHINVIKCDDFYVNVRENGCVSNDSLHINVIISFIHYRRMRVFIRSPFRCHRSDGYAVTYTAAFYTELSLVSFRAFAVKGCISSHYVLFLQRTSFEYNHRDVFKVIYM